jgi:hypothetical protein
MLTTASSSVSSNPPQSLVGTNGSSVTPGSPSRISTTTGTDTSHATITHLRGRGHRTAMAADAGAASPLSTSAPTAGAPIADTAARAASASCPPQIQLESTRAAPPQVPDERPASTDTIARHSQGRHASCSG